MKGLFTETIHLHIRGKMLLREIKVFNNKQGQNKQKNKFIRRERKSQSSLPINKAYLKHVLLAGSETS